MDLRADFDL